MDPSLEDPSSPTTGQPRHAPVPPTLSVVKIDAKKTIKKILPEENGRRKP
jgi:hypothetical protein